MSKVKILLADDHKLVLEGLKLMIESFDNFEVVGEVYNGQDAIDYLNNNKVDVILLDLNMPILNGIDATKKIKDKNPEQKIIILSMLSDIKLIKKLIKIGADGYLLKNSGQQEIINAINDVMADRTHYDQRIMEMILKSGNDQKTKTNYLPSLSRREKEILGLIIKEHTTNEIAEKLFISSGTVESHRRNMISKLGVRNTAGLVSMAYEYGLLDG